MNDLPKILDAASFAAVKHKDQTRKGNGQPYINHPLEVANILATIGGVDDDDMIIAALLHDTVEDTDATFEDLEKKFGPRITGFVRELTDDKSLPKQDRKRLQVEHAPHMTHEAKQIKLADKISNIRDVTDNPPPHWPIERRREYVEWGERVVAGLRGSNQKLEKLFDDLVATAREKIG
ncbi:MAG TPA: HD domain-containing protein [Pyrinomonadaceae bacterium]|nr:HD domain-containing protein [Pyrinomonadaceae bacterium]